MAARVFPLFLLACLIASVGSGKSRQKRQYFGVYDDYGSYYPRHRPLRRAHYGVQVRRASSETNKYYTPNFSQAAGVHFHQPKRRSSFFSEELVFGALLGGLFALGGELP